jgi:predicted nicotinamide N-methyase
VPIAHATKWQYEQETAAGLNPPFPYWARLWPSAISLATFIEAHPQYVDQKNVLELAAGLGLPSLVAAHVASQVVCTDLSEEAMQVAAKSAALAGLQHMQCRPMNWKALDENLTADVLLLSDVNYEPAVFESLLQVIQSFLKNGTTILLATPQRLMAKAFVEQLMPYCQHQEALEVKDSTGLHHISIFVLNQII